MDVAARFNLAYSLPALEAAAATARLLEETLRLVELQFPDIDTGLVRTRLRVTRPAHAELVHLD